MGGENEVSVRESDRSHPAGHRPMIRPHGEGPCRFHHGIFPFSARTHLSCLRPLVRESHGQRRHAEKLSEEFFSRWVVGHGNKVEERIDSETRERCFACKPKFGREFFPGGK